MLSEQEKNSFRITRRDLEDPTLFRINRTVEFLAELISKAREEVEAVRLVADNAIPWDGTGGAPVQAGTHDERLKVQPNDVGAGFIFVETDRDAIYQVQYTSPGVLNIVFVAGLYRNTLANIPTDLKAIDTGFLFHVSDYHHLLRWGGAAWGWGPAEEGRAGEIAMFAVAPSGAGWKLCDGTGDDGNPGTNIAYLKADGTTANVVIPNLAAGAYLKAAAAYGGAVNPAVAPTTSASLGVNVFPIGAGINNTVSHKDHTHTVNLPGDPIPNMELLPYFRK